jgi:cytochrome c oxidase assembly protein subunit 15
MESRGLHWYTISLGVCTLFLIVNGASLPIANGASLAGYGGIFSERGHYIVAGVVGLLTAGLVVWLLRDAKRAWLRPLGWAALCAIVIEGALGFGAYSTTAAAVAILHACLAQIFFSIVAAIAVFTSSGWERDPELVEDNARPSVRTLAIVTPALVLAQVVLGAEFRHKVLGVLPHIAGAIVVALLILVTCMVVDQQFPKHRALRSAAHALMTITFLQVALGIATITVQMMTTEDTPSALYTGIAHVTNGALTLAASLVLALQVRRNVVKSTPLPEAP